MHKKYRLVMMMIAAIAVGPARGQAQTLITCKARSCYERLVDDYLAALVAHDPTRIAFAPDARFIENIKGHEDWRWTVEDGLGGAHDPSRSMSRTRFPARSGSWASCRKRVSRCCWDCALQVFAGHVIQAEHVIARDLDADKPGKSEGRPPGVYQGDSGKDAHATL